MKYTITFLIVFFCGYLNAQTYATPELKAQEEKHIVEKNARLSATNSEKNENVVVAPTNKVFDKKLLEGAYYLSNIEIINWESAYSEQQIKKDLEELSAKYNIYDLILTKDLMALIRTKKSSDFATFKVSELTFYDSNTLMTKCETCSKTYFNIVENLGGIVVVHSQGDDGKSYKYKYTFKTLN